ncbi:MAG: lysophospholipase [Myxococcota bacterium]|nr:lysophospholipase [Myxococcota bacterium]MDW8362482.1 hypothetical protein [Myxococcales bacterium]
MALALGIAGPIGCGGGERRADAGTMTDAPVDAGSGDAGRPDWPEARPPTTTRPELGIVRELVRVPGTRPPPNPATGAETPPELDATQVVRYRQDVEPPAAAHAIVIAYPGFLGGAGSFDALARALVRRGAASGVPLEVWAIDRRSYALEDLRGLDAAEVAGDPEIAHGYHFRGHTVGGVAFGGFRGASSLSFMSEWGLRTHVEDLRAVLALVPASERRGRIFLLGHSLGAAFAEAYAGWRFEDGTRGAEELAGLVLVDGSLREAPIDEETYRRGSSSGPFPMPGLDAIRARSPFTELPLLGVAVLARAEILCLRVRAAPRAVQEDPGRDDVLALLLGLRRSELPRLTNAAALGLGFDDASSALAFAAVSLGAPTGGPLEEADGLLGGRIRRPSDPEATYDWIDAPEADPPELTPMAHLVASFVDGRTNFAEWYFPSRLALDLGAVAGPDQPEDGWQAREGLRSFDREHNDAPVLAVAAGLVPVEAYRSLPTRLAPRIGEDRPAAGASRDESRALRVLDATHMTHVDPLTAADGPRNPVPSALLEFVLAHAAPGGTRIETPRP